MAKVGKEALYLVSSAGTGYFYTLRVNKKKRRGDGKMSLKKYDPIARKHVEFNEKKLSKLKKKFSTETESTSDDTSKTEASKSE